MAKKILVLNGSPRKRGNTRAVVGWMAAAARAAGAEVEVVDVCGLKYKLTGCIACMGCQALDEFECVLDDEAAALVARVPDADAIVFATPVYFFGPTAQLKAVLDRMYSLIQFRHEAKRIDHPLGGKTMALVATAGGDVGSGLAAVEQQFKAIAGFLGLPFRSLLVPFAPRQPGEIEAREEVRAQAEAFGKKLAE